jgi:hypothetical protein
MSERSSQRYDISVGVIVRWDGKSEPCLSHTLSKGGLSIGTQKRWPVGNIVDIEIVHEKTRLRTTARVANATKNAVGLEFYEPSEEFEVALAELLAKFVPQAGVAAVLQPAKASLDIPAEWEAPEDSDAPKRWWKSKRTKTKLIDLSLDGAAVVGKKPPAIGSTVTLYITPPAAPGDGSGEVQATAKIVRHTERGFAIQFVNPSQAFRRAVSDLRKAARA